MELTEAHFGIRGIHVTNEWTDSQWDELANLVRGRVIGMLGEQHFIEYAVLEGSHPALARIEVGDIVTISRDNTVKVFTARDFILLSDADVKPERDLRRIAGILGDGTCSLHDIADMVSERVGKMRQHQTEQHNAIKSLEESVNHVSGLLERLRSELEIDEGLSYANVVETVLDCIRNRDDLLFRVHGIVRLMHNDEELGQWVADHMGYRNQNSYYGKPPYVPMESKFDRPSGSED